MIIHFILTVSDRSSLMFYTRDHDDLLSPLPSKVVRSNLALKKHQLKVNNCSHFPIFVEVNGKGEHHSEKYSNCIRTLIEEFSDRFSYLKARELLIRISSLLSVEIEMPHQ
jgi:hypothetical protein